MKNVNENKSPYWLGCKCLCCGKYVPKEKLNDLEYVCSCIKFIKSEDNKPDDSLINYYIG